jgi:hypothetical protein
MGVRARSSGEARPRQVVPVGKMVRSMPVPSRLRARRRARNACRVKSLVGRAFEAYPEQIAARVDRSILKSELPLVSEIHSPPFWW